MKVFLATLEKEALENLISLRFLGAIVLCLFLVSLSLFILEREYVKTKAAHDTRSAIHDRLIKGTHSFHDLGDKGMMLQKPLPALKLFSKGVTNQKNDSIWFSRYREPTHFGDVIINPLHELFPPLDIVFIAGVIMSLLAIIFSYNLVSRERENGTLRLIFSNSVPRAAFLAGKWLVGYSCVLVPFTLSCILGALWILLSPNVGLSREDYKAIVFVFIATLFYMALFFNLGLLISSRARNSYNSLIILLLIWILIVIVYPSLIPYFVSHLYPVPSDKEILIRKRLLFDDARQRFEESTDFEELGESLHVRKKEWLRLWDSLWTEEFSSLHQEVQSKMQHQIALMGALGRLSPYGLLRSLILDMVNTGISAELEFRRQAYKTYLDFVRYVGESADYSVEYDHTASIDLREMSRFSYFAPSFSEKVSSSLFPLAVLILGNIFLFLLTYRSFLRCDIIR